MKLASQIRTFFVIRVERAVEMQNTNNSLEKELGAHACRIYRYTTSVQGCMLPVVYTGTPLVYKVVCYSSSSIVVVEVTRWFFIIQPASRQALGDRSRAIAEL